MTKKEWEYHKGYKTDPNYPNCDAIYNIRIQADIAYQLTRIADAMEEWMKPEIKLAETLGGNTKPADAIGKE